MEKWILYNKKADFNKIAKECNINPVVARCIRNKDIMSVEDINKYLYGAYVYNDMHIKDIKKGCEILIDAIKENKNIRIIGDYDVDGICATYVFYDALTKLSSHITYDIPDRIEDGYGLNNHLIEKAYNDGINLIITCDNGISAIEAIDYANSLGIEVIVTDHHEVSKDNNGRDILPNAKAVIDIKRKDCLYPFKEICGAVVAYKFCKVLYALLNKTIEDYDVYAMIATICDVMPLVDENRTIVKSGLNKCLNTSNQGLKALFNVNGLTEISAYYIAFIIGPCLNATGRLNSAMQAMELLLCKDKDKCEELANEIYTLNEERKAMCTNITNKVFEDLKHINDKIIVLNIDCHESLVGIIAGKIKEKCNKPAIVFTKTKDGILKGSGRSIEAYDMFTELSKFKDMYISFGGHKLASGISIKEEDFNKFKNIVNNNCTLKDYDLCKKIYIDVPMPLYYADEDLINDIDKMAPFGNGNSKPIFATKSVTFIDLKVLGKNRNVIKIIAVDNEYGKMHTLMYFGKEDELREIIDTKYGALSMANLQNGIKHSPLIFDIIYEPEINEFRGEKTIQFIIKGLT